MYEYFIYMCVVIELQLEITTRYAELGTVWTQRETHRPMISDVSSPTNTHHTYVMGQSADIVRV